MRQNVANRLRRARGHPPSQSAAPARRRPTDPHRFGLAVCPVNLGPTAHQPPPIRSQSRKRPCFHTPSSGGLGRPTKRPVIYTTTSGIVPGVGTALGRRWSGIEESCSPGWASSSEHDGWPRRSGAILQWTRDSRAVDQGGEVRPELDSAVVPSVRGQPGASVSVRPGVQPWELPSPAVSAQGGQALVAAERAGEADQDGTASPKPRFPNQDNTPSWLGDRLIMRIPKSRES